MKLKSIYSSQKQFPQTEIIVSGEVVKLKSYNTIVAVKENNTIQVNGYYSQTTARHVNEFLQQNGIAPLSKKDMTLKPLIQL